MVGNLQISHNVEENHEHVYAHARGLISTDKDHSRFLYWKHESIQMHVCTTGGGVRIENWEMTVSTFVPVKSIYLLMLKTLSLRWRGSNFNWGWQALSKCEADQLYSTGVREYRNWSEYLLILDCSKKNRVSFAWLTRAHLTFSKESFPSDVVLRSYRNQTVVQFARQISLSGMFDFFRF